MLEIPEYRYNKTTYKRFYYVRIIKKLLKKYNLLTSLKIVSKRFSKHGLKFFLRKNFNYFTDENFTDLIYFEIIKDYYYKPKEIKIKVLPNIFNFSNKDFQKKYKHINHYSDEQKLEISKRMKKIHKNNSKEYYENFSKKVKQTKLKNHGNENYNNTEKNKQTCLERYGVENYSKTKDFKNLIKEQIKTRNFNEILEKSKQTKLERYNDENYCNIDKIKNTKLERYNDENYVNFEQSRQTCLERYGVEFYSQTLESKLRYKNTCFEKYGVYNYFQINLIHYEVYNEQFIRKNFIKDGLFENESLMIYFNLTRSAVDKIKRKFNILEPNKFTLEYKWISEIEKIYNISLERQYYIKPYKVDGYISKIPESLKFLLTENEKVKGIVFEFLGDYWHGNLDVYNESEINRVTKSSMNELFEKTFQRFQYLKNLNYKIFFQWESDYLENGLNLIEF